jgi:predicted nucleotidyltransferase
MDLASPLATVTPTLDAAVLQALSATTGASTGAHVQRMAGVGSADGVRRVLARLVRQGIVLAEEHAHASLYRLNREHVAHEPILALTRLRATIVDRITSALGGWQVAPMHASLFGSFARGEAGADSDIDILVVWDSAEPHDSDPPDDHLGAGAGLTATWAAQVEALAGDVWRWTGNPAHILDVTPATLVDMLSADDPLVESWRVEHVHLTGTRLLDLLRTLRAGHGLGLKGLK